MLDQRIKQALYGEDAMVAFGRAMGNACRGERAVIYLKGNLGMGKTTLSRGFLSSFGHTGAVKSPTYTLVEPYEFDDMAVYHFDLYRLGDPEELEYMGIRDYFSGNSLCLVEWPEKGEPFLPPADLKVSIELIENGQDGRSVEISAETSTGEALLSRLVVSK